MPHFKHLRSFYVVSLLDYDSPPKPTRANHHDFSRASATSALALVKPIGITVVSTSRSKASRSHPKASSNILLSQRLTFRIYKPLELLVSTVVP
ncbi:hypothetical protein V6N11_024145 [Hibiscus sabdariffa]|uniref:Uncharacterized protein n=2 Tax=Hibiscus sabdariffa TaxID=183260 RepID=A0ABR2ADN2_9ROSI